MAECPLCSWERDPDQRAVLRNDLVVFLQSPRWQGALVGSGIIELAKERRCSRGDGGVGRTTTNGERKPANLGLDASGR